MYFDRSPLYSQRIITYKKWSTLRQSEFHKPIWNLLSVLQNNFVKIVQLFLWEQIFQIFFGSERKWMRIRKQSAKKYVWHICDRIFHFKKYCQSIVKDDVKFVNRRFSFSCFVLFTWCVCRSLDIGEKRRTLKSPWRENFLFCFATWLKGFGSRTEGEWPLVMIEDFPQL